MPPARYDILSESKADRQMEGYLAEIDATPLLAQFEGELKLVELRLRSRPFRWGEKKYCRKGGNGLVGTVCAGGCTLFWIRYVVYPQINLVLITEFGGRS